VNSLNKTLTAVDVPIPTVRFGFTFNLTSSSSSRPWEDAVATLAVNLSTLPVTCL
jgi:hypothetical protein